MIERIENDYITNQRGGKLPSQRPDMSEQFQKWEQAVGKVLKGASPDRLTTTWIEGITTKPLYTEKTSSFPVRSWGNTDWTIAQRVSGESAPEMISRLKVELKKGSGALAVSEKSTVSWTVQEVEEMLALQQEPHVFSLNGSFNTVLASVNKPFKGVAADSVLSPVVNSGLLLKKEHLTEWKRGKERWKKTAPAVKTILLTAVPYQRTGGNAIQELACLLSEAAFVFEQLGNDGWRPEEIASRIHVQFAIGASYFMEVAKLRAFRVLWQQFLRCYSISLVPVTVGAETSSFTKTVQDPHVNLLRAGNEAFAAVTGGVTYLHVEPYNAPADDEKSRRMARNIQLILKEEAFLSSAVDPSGGSYYIESLTRELAEKAWESFLQMEDNGGIVELLHSGSLQKELAQTREMRLKDAATRKRTIVGTNRYAPYTKQEASHVHDRKEVTEVEPLVASTIGEQWEQLVERVLSQELPPVQLISLGALKDHKPRTDFAQGLLLAAGLTWTDGPSPVVMICGKKEAYEEQLDDTIQSLHAEMICVMGENEHSGVTTVKDGDHMIALLSDIVAALAKGGEQE